MHRFIRVSLVALVVASVVTGRNEPVSARQAPAGVDTGKKVGNIIKSAIDVALPGVAAIMDIIWPKGKDSIKKEDLEKALKDARTKFFADAQKQVANIDVVGKELRTVSLFLDSMTGAGRRVMAMRVRLEATPPAWPAIETDWKVVKNRLEGLKKIDDATLLNIRDTSLQRDFKAVKSVHLELLTDIEAALADKKDVDRLRGLLGDLAKILDGVDALVGLEILGLGQEVNELSTWAKGGQGTTTSPEGSRKLYNDVLQQSLKRDTAKSSK